MSQNSFMTAPAATIRSLGTTETKESIDQWYNQVRACVRAIHPYNKYIDVSWKSCSEDVNRGFEEVTLGGQKISPEAQSSQVEGLLDLVTTYAPELDVSHIREEATSLQWLYSYIREHYGCKRTGRQMMQKFTVLKRRDGEKLNAYWNRWQGHYAENRIRKQDAIKISKNGKITTAEKDEDGERYRLSSDIVNCLFMCHPDLPAEVEKLLSGKLESQDVASLQKEIFTKANIVLEQLESRGASNRRISTVSTLH